MRRVLILSGARQCGKTTLARQLAIDSATYRSLDDIGLRQLAQSDPHSFVKYPGKMLIIDEIQRAPDLLSAINRDREQRESDFLIEREDNALLGIEVKAASVVNQADFKHLKDYIPAYQKNSKICQVNLRKTNYTEI